MTARTGVASGISQSRVHVAALRSLAPILAALPLMAVFPPKAGAQNLNAMAQASVVVFGVISQGGDLKAVERGGGFFVDPKHVVTSLNACCGKTKEGKTLQPVAIVAGKPVPARPIWSLQQGDLAVVELQGSFNNPAATLAPIGFASKGQQVMTLQYADNLREEPAWNRGKIADFSRFRDSGLAVLLSNAQTTPANFGSALWNACGEVVGVTYNFKDGTLVAVQTDQLVAGLKANGIRPYSASQPCKSGDGDNQGVGAGAGQNGSGTQKDKQRPPDDEKADVGNSWRMPRGSEWIPVIIIAGVALLALRPAHKQAAQAVRAITGRHRVPVPAVAVPVADPAAAPGFGMTPAPPSPLVGKPVLRGVAGEYAGAAVTLDAAPSTLGRDPHSVNLVFAPEAALVSKRHCTIRWDVSRGVFVLEDHGSTNGTFLASGERLAANQPRDLRPGERFYIGDLSNQFEVGFE
jgi:hypothetical protein